MEGHLRTVLFQSSRRHRRQKIISQTNEPRAVCAGAAWKGPIMLPALIGTWFALSIVIGYLGRNQRFGFWGLLFGSILLTPVMGVLLLCAGIPLNRKS